MRGRTLSRAAATARAHAAPVFAALGDQTRLGLVQQLGSAGPQSIARLSAGSAMTRQAITKHLLVLDSAGLVRSTRRGRERIWECDPTPLAEAGRFLDAVSIRWDAALSRLQHRVER